MWPVREAKTSLQTDVFTGKPLISNLEEIIKPCQHLFISMREKSSLTPRGLRFRDEEWWRCQCDTSNTVKPQISLRLGSCTERPKQKQHIYRVSLRLLQLTIDLSMSPHTIFQTDISWCNRLSNHCAGCQLFQKYLKCLCFKTAGFPAKIFSFIIIRKQESTNKNNNKVKAPLIPHPEEHTMHYLEISLQTEILVCVRAFTKYSLGIYSL